MTTPPPRLPPIAPEQFTPEQAELAGDRAWLNFVRVMVRHPDLYRTYIPFGDRLMRGSALPPRDREILILRTLALCEETYDTPHHVMIADGLGMSAAEIAAAQAGRGLGAFEQTLVRAAEELVGERRLSDATWAALAERYGEAQRMELVLLVGNYVMMAMATRSFDMQPEEAHP